MYTIIFTYDGYHIQQKQTDEINYYKEENSRLEKQVFHSVYYFNTMCCMHICMYICMYANCDKGGVDQSRSGCVHHE